MPMFLRVVSFFTYESKFLNDVSYISDQAQFQTGRRRSKTKTKAAIRNLDFDFENSPARIIANRNCPEIKLAGLDVGPFEEGNEYETYYWVAHELHRCGIAHFREDESLNSTKLSKIQWTERVQASGQLSKLPGDLYPRLRRLLLELKQDVSKSPEKMLEYEKAKHLTRDVVNSRLRKIVSIASAPAQSEQTLKNLTKEEHYLYEQLHLLISEWRSQILEYEENDEE